MRRGKEGGKRRGGEERRRKGKGFAGPMSNCFICACIRKKTES